MNIYDQSDYKVILKTRAKDLRATQPQKTLKKLAQSIPVQYTFLSKVLNSDSAHLNEDHLFHLCRQLDFLPDEADFILLLRAAQTAQSSHRKEHCLRKIEQVRRSRKLSADYASTSSDGLKNEMNYLFNPHCMLVHVALFIKEYQKSPGRLGTLLGISHEKMRDVLVVLENNGYIVTGEDPFEIKEVKQRYPHFGPEHPLVRLHQSTIKSHLLQRLSQSSEKDKDSFFVTFTMDEEGFDKVKNLFREFLSQVQKITFDSKHKHLYQMSFDFLRWL